MNIAKKLAKNMNIKHIPEKKFSESKYLPAPVICLKITWEYSDYTDDNKDIIEKGAFDVHVMGTHYKEIDSEFYEITKWDSEDNIVIDTGNKKIDKIVSNSITCWFGDRMKAEFNRQENEPIQLTYDSEHGRGWLVEYQRDSFDFGVSDYQDDKLEECVDISVYADFVKNEPEVKKKTKNDDTPSCDQ